MPEGIAELKDNEKAVLKEYLEMLEDRQIDRVDNRLTTFLERLYQIKYAVNGMLGAKAVMAKQRAILAKLVALKDGDLSEVK